MKNLAWKAIAIITVITGVYLGMDSWTIETILNGQEATGADRAALITLAIMLTTVVVVALGAWLVIPILLGTEIFRKILHKVRHEA